MSVHQEVGPVLGQDRTTKASPEGVPLHVKPGVYRSMMVKLQYAAPFLVLREDALLEMRVTTSSRRGLLFGQDS